MWSCHGGQVDTACNSSLTLLQPPVTVRICWMTASQALLLINLRDMSVYRQKCCNGVLVLLVFVCLFEV